MVGSVIREYRKKQKLTLKDLAELAGLTPGGLSQIERGTVDPSLSALRRISKALNISMNVMFADDNPRYVSRRVQRTKAFFSDVYVDYEFLTPKPGGQSSLVPRVEVVQVSLRPGARGNEIYSAHDADECFVVIHGSIQVDLPSDSVVLDEGDSIYLKEGTLHRLYNPTVSEAVGLSILSEMIY